MKRLTKLVVIAIVLVSANQPAEAQFNPIGDLVGEAGKSVVGGIGKGIGDATIGAGKALLEVPGAILRDARPQWNLSDIPVGSIVDGVVTNPPIANPTMPTPYFNGAPGIVYPNQMQPAVQPGYPSSQMQQPTFQSQRVIRNFGRGMRNQSIRRSPPAGVLRSGPFQGGQRPRILGRFGR